MAYSFFNILLYKPFSVSMILSFGGVARTATSIGVRPVDGFTFVSVAPE